MSACDRFHDGEKLPSRQKQKKLPSRQKTIDQIYLRRDYDLSAQFSGVFFLSCSGDSVSQNRFWARQKSLNNPLRCPYQIRYFENMTIHR